MSNELATTSQANIIESVVIGGDLSKLTPEQRVHYYRQVCQSLNLNPLTKPFDYITLNGKLTLYARKDCTEQLRRQHGISIDKPDIAFQDDWIIVTVTGRDASGRTDSDIGVVSKKDMRGDFGNAVMKAVTKAKRRLTLSICGLGMLDETEVETIPDARPVIVQETGEIVEQTGNGKNDDPNSRPPSAEGRKAWQKLYSQALAMGLEPPKAPDDVTAAQLKTMYQELKDGMKAIEAAEQEDAAEASK